MLRIEGDVGKEEEDEENVEPVTVATVPEPDRRKRSKRTKRFDNLSPVYFSHGLGTDTFSNYDSAVAPMRPYFF